MLLGRAVCFQPVSLLPGTCSASQTPPSPCRPQVQEQVLLLLSFVLEVTG